MIDFHNWFVDGFYNGCDSIGIVIQNVFPYVICFFVILMVVFCILILSSWFWVWAHRSITAFRVFKEIFDDRLVSKKDCEAAFKIFWEKFR